MLTRWLEHVPIRFYGQKRFLHILASFLECKMAIFFKSFPRCHFTVYNAEKKFVGSSNPMTWVVKRTKLNSKKSFFRDTLLFIPPSIRLPPRISLYPLHHPPRCCFPSHQKLAPRISWKIDLSHTQTRSLVPLHHSPRWTLGYVAALLFIHFLHLTLLGFRFPRKTITLRMCTKSQKRWAN